MKKLYERSELAFALTAIGVYVFVLGTVKANTGTMSLLNAADCVLLTLLLAVFLKKNHLYEKYGLHFWPKFRPYGFFLPLLILGFLNLFTGVSVNAPALNLCYGVISMICVGFLEELIFRGFLYEAINQEDHRKAVIISAVTFGIGHIINLLTGEATLDTILQISYAISLGFLFVIVYDRSGSLWPCIVTHMLIDVTSLFANDESPIASIMLPVEYVLIFILSLSYLFYLRKKFPKSPTGSDH